LIKLDIYAHESHFSQTNHGDTISLRSPWHTFVYLQKLQTDSCASDSAVERILSGMIRLRRKTTITLAISEECYSTFNCSLYTSTLLSTKGITTIILKVKSKCHYFCGILDGTFWNAYFLSFSQIY